MFPVVVIVVILVVAVIVSEIRRGAYLSARKGVPEGDLEIPLEVADSASHHAKHTDHDCETAQADCVHGHDHHATPDITHHDSGAGAFHDSAGHSGFDGGAFDGGHH